MFSLLAFLVSILLGVIYFIWATRRARRKGMSSAVHLLVRLFVAFLVAAIFFTLYTQADRRFVSDEEYLEMMGIE